MNQGKAHAHKGPLISAHALSEIITAQGVKVIDGSWRLDPAAAPASAAFEKRRIPGAVFFDLDAIADQASDLPHMLPTRAQFDDAVRRLGVTRNDTIIIYDDAGIFSAPRVWWTFRVMGYPNVQVLDGGLPAWCAAGHVLDEQMAEAIRSLPPEPECAAPSHAVVTDAVVPNAVVTDAVVTDAASMPGFKVAGKEHVLEACQPTDPRAVILDARPSARFLGNAPEPRPGLRAGAMPNAINLPSASVLTETGTMRRRTELVEVFDQLGVVSGENVIATCGSGVTAAILILALELTGHGHHALYDGSWAEWGLEKYAASLPVVRACPTQAARNLGHQNGHEA